MGLQTILDSDQKVLDNQYDNMKFNAGLIYKEGRCGFYTNPTDCIINLLPGVDVHNMSYMTINVTSLNI